MTTTVRTIAVLAFFALAACQFPPGHASSANSGETYSPQELPDLFISFKVIVGRYGPIDGRSPAPFQVLRKNLDFVSRLDSSFNKIPELADRLLWSHEALIVQSNLPGHVSGFPVENNDVKDSGARLLFVTTPVASLQNSILVILSFTGPGHVSIVRVNERLDVDLVFDSARTFFGGTRMCSIRSVRVDKPGVFVLEEGSLGSCNALGHYSYTLDVTSGEIKLARIPDATESECPD